MGPSGRAVILAATEYPARSAIARHLIRAPFTIFPGDVLFSRGVFRTVAPRLLALPPLSASLLPGCFFCKRSPGSELRSVRAPGSNNRKEFIAPVLPT